MKVTATKTKVAIQQTESHLQEIKAKGKIVLPQPEMTKKAVEQEKANQSSKDGVDKNETIK